MEIFSPVFAPVVAIAKAVAGLFRRHRRVHVKVEWVVPRQLLVVETTSRRPGVKFRPIAVEVETGGNRYPVPLQHFRFQPSCFRYGAWEVPEPWVQDAVLHAGDTEPALDHAWKHPEWWRVVVKGDDGSTYRAPIANVHRSAAAAS